MKKLYNAFGEFYKKHIALIVLYVFLVLGFRISHFIFPIFAAGIIDAVTNFSSMEVFWGAVFWLVSSSLAYIIVVPLRYYFENKIETNFVVHIVEKIILKVPNLKYENVKDTSTGHLLQLVGGDTDRVKSLVVTDIVLIAVNALYVLGIVIYLINVHFIMSFIIAGVILIFIFVSKILLPKLQEQNEKVIDEFDKVNNLADDVLGGFMTIKTANAHNFIKNKVKTIMANYYNLMLRYVRKDVVFEHLGVSGLLVVGTVLIYVFGGYFVILGQLTIAEITLITLFFTTLWSTIDYLMFMVKEIKVNAVSISRIDNFISMPQELAGHDEVGVFETLSLENIHYDIAGKDILKGVSVTLHKGDKVLITGGNGSGKSTLSMLMIGLISPTTGQISYNAKPMSSLDLLSLRDRIILIPAEPYVFEGDIYDNFFGENTSIDLMNLEKYENISKKGENLSSGEKKIMQISQGLSREGCVYILDEPLNFVDEKAKTEIVNIIKKMSEDKTIIIISHETNVLEFCSQKYRLSNGVLE